MTFPIRRLASCFVDHVIFSILAGIITLPGLIYEMMQHMFEGGFIVGNIFLNTIGLSIYLCKDALFVRSFGKQIFGLDLVRNDLDQRPSAFQAYVRNLTALIWPVEILMLAYTPSQKDWRLHHKNAHHWSSPCRYRRALHDEQDIGICWHDANFVCNHAGPGSSNYMVEWGHNFIMSGSKDVQVREEIRDS